jgi:ribokinase
MLVCTLGDLLLDVIVRLEAPLAPGDDAPAATVVGAGGQAANVAAWVVALGGRARVIAKHGADAAGELCAQELSALGVELVGPRAGRNGVVVSLVARGGERTMASDRGVAPALRAEEIEPGWLDGCDTLHVSGYALLRQPIAAAAERAAELAREGGARVSVDLSSWTAIRAGGADVLARLERVAPDVVFASEAERDALGGDLDTRWVLKRGAGGILVDGRAYPAAPVDVVDTTGAGDALAAGFLVGSPELGLEAAARCVARLGSLP